jgi:RNA polymerase sigma-70 factor (ECF subfamily)
MTKQVHDEMLREGQIAGGERDVTDSSSARSLPVAASEELVARARRGDAAAFDALARVRIDHSYRLALAILRSETNARDAVQDAYLQAWRMLPGLRDTARFDAWLDRILVNACRMQLRHHRVVRLREIDVAEPADFATASSADPPPDEHVADADLVRLAMDRLDGDQRSLLVLHHVEDRPVAEIAKVLGIPIGTVKWRLHAARAALQRALDEVQS